LATALFVKAEFVKYLGYNTNTKEHFFAFKIQDTNFTRIIIANRKNPTNSQGRSSYDISIELVNAIIRCYRRKPKLIAPNLVKMFVFCSTQATRNVPEPLDIGIMIELNKEVNPVFDQYVADLEKYLLLI
jgi:hypothetical protein